MASRLLGKGVVVLRHADEGGGCQWGRAGYDCSGCRAWCGYDGCVPGGAAACGTRPGAPERGTAGTGTTMPGAPGASAWTRFGSIVGFVVVVAVGVGVECCVAVGSSWSGIDASDLSVLVVVGLAMLVTMARGRQHCLQEGVSAWRLGLFL